MVTYSQRARLLRDHFLQCMDTTLVAMIAWGCDCIVKSGCSLDMDGGERGLDSLLFLGGVLALTLRACSKYEAFGVAIPVSVSDARRRRKKGLSSSRAKNARRVA